MRPYSVSMAARSLPKNSSGFDRPRRPSDVVDASSTILSGIASSPLLADGRRASISVRREVLGQAPSGGVRCALLFLLNLAVAALAGRSTRAAELDVLITEVHYNVLWEGGEDTREFVEVQNRGATQVDISGWRFSEGIDFTFPDGTLLAPGAYTVVCADPATAQSIYKLERPFGPFAGRLDNQGEVLTLVNAAGWVINRIHFDDDGPWPARPDGRGPSLEFAGRGGGRHGSNDQGLRWKPSLYLDGTPGAPNSRYANDDGTIPRGAYMGRVLNEVKSPSPQESGFVEFYNRRSEPLDLSGHFVISSGLDLVFQVPDGTVLAPGAHATFAPAAMPLISEERRFLLLAPDGRTILDDMDVEPGLGRSSGRFPDGDDDVHVLDAPTPGAANAYTEDRSVVITEINYHPPFVPPDADCPSRCSDLRQWIELHNPGGEAVDLTGWRLTSAVSFTFDAVSIPAGGYLVLAANAAAFREVYPGVADVVGDWTGRLSHASETIVLRNHLGNPVDRVEYGDGGPVNDEEPADGIDDRTIRSSFWPRTPDGEGPTLELIHPALSNRAAVAWRASSQDGGTPGAENSRFDSQPPPTVRDVEHSPAVPTSADDVIVTCRISSVAPLANARLRWSIDGGGGQGVIDLVDDGSGADAVAGDGKFTAAIAAQSDGVVIRFSVEVTDTVGAGIRVPLEPQVDPYGGYPGTFYLYEVDDDRGPATSPSYRIVMKAADVNELGDRPLASDVLLPATFIADDRAYHLVGVRYRGENSRRQNNRSYKVRFTAEEPFDGIDNLNINAGNGGQFGVRTFAEILANDTFRRADVPYPVSWPVSLHFPGEVSRDFDTRYVRKEAYDDDFLSRTFGGSDDGNLYRARNPIPGGPSGDLSYRGDDPDEYRDLYEKRTNEEEDDFSDIIELCRSFDPGETSAEDFRVAMDTLVDARQWARFFAVMACLSNTDGGIWNTNGEDYFLYRVPTDSSRPDAGRWLVLPWDNEETFAEADQRLFRSTVDSIQRFFSIPEHAKLYYEELRRARDGAFSRLQMRQRFRHADVMYDPADVFDVVDAYDTNLTVRLGFIESEVSWSLGVGAAGTDPGSSGVPVIVPGDDWQFFRGTEPPPGGGSEWTTLGYNDSGWEAGPSGFGYGDGDDATRLNDMRGNYTTLFARRQFEVADPSVVTGMTFTIDYDDAFVAYLNGVEIARSNNAPNIEVITFNMTARSNHEASGGGFGANPPEVRDLSARTTLLEAGTNVLAVVGLNDDLGSSDFSLIPSLSIATDDQGGGGPAGGCGDQIYAQGTTVRLDGVCNPATTQSVTVAGGAPINVTLIDGGNGPWGGRWSTEVSGLQSGANVILIAAYSEPDGAGELVESQEIIIRRVPQGFRAVGGPLGGNVTWTAAEGPYRITDDVVVGGSASLTIEPGAVVLADENASIIVRGVLNAEGSAAEPISILAYECGANWGGIALDRTGTGGNDPLHTLQHVHLRDGEAPNGFAGCVAAVNAKVLVADCEISRIPDNAIDAANSELEVRNTHIHDIFEGVHCNTSTTIISDSTIERMMGNSDAIDFDGSGPERSVIERCLLRASSDDGIDLGNVTVDIRDNVLVGIEDKAISIEGPGAQGSPTLTGNLVYASGSGMAIKNGIDVSEGWHNTVANCQEGVQLYAKDEAPDGGHATFHSMIVWENSVDLFVDELSSVSFEFSNVRGNEVLPGEGNVMADPMFINAPAGNYSLGPGSPCIGTGLDGEDMGAVPFDSTEAPFVRGDANLTGRVDIADPVFTLNYLFRSGDGPVYCLDILDSNDDGTTDVSDVSYTLNYLFTGGPAIPPPFPEPGFDPTQDGNACGARG